MDPVTHTLVGAAFAEAGLKRQTALGTATLVIGANLPDVDVLSYAWGPTVALSVRRGWTHGVLAIVVLPIVLTGLIVGWDRWVRRRQDPGSQPVRANRVLLLAALAVLSHPLLDFLNVYGMRWLMPFSGEWFYGDTLFIVDPWVWAVLVGGIVLARRRGTVRPARAALGVMVAYVALMGVGMLSARAGAVRSAGRAGPAGPVMAAPVPVNPFARYVVIEEAESYRIGTWSVLRGVTPAYRDMAVVSKRDRLPAAVAVRDVPDARRFLGWARFPYFEVTRDAVHIIDARYALDADAPFGTQTVEVDAP